MENPVKKQTKLYCFQETRYFFSKFRNFDELQLPQSLMFFAGILHTFPTYQCLQKSVRNFSYFVQILSYFQKLKRPGFHTLVLPIFINQDLKIKKSRTPFCRHYFKQEMCAKFQQKILKSVVVGCQSLQFFRQATWFLGNNRALPEFRYRILHKMISTMKL